jgi:hypothetical protein
MKIKLLRPFKKNDVEITELDVDLENIKGTQIIDAEREARALGEHSPNPLFSSMGLAIIASKASGHITDDILNLTAPDYLRVTNTVSNFLYGWVLPGLIPASSEG